MIRIALHSDGSIASDCLVALLGRQEGVALLAVSDGWAGLARVAGEAMLDAVVVKGLVGSDRWSQAPLRARSIWPASVVLAAGYGGVDDAAMRAGYDGVVGLDEEEGVMAEQLVATVRGGKREARGRSPEGVSKGQYGGLTGREEQVLKYLALGFSSKDLARALGLTSRTIDSHKRRLSRKLGIGSLAGLTRHSIATGLIDPFEDPVMMTTESWGWDAGR